MRRVTSPTLIGRGAELQRLRAACRSAREADRCVVLLSGEAGIGKSRLLAEFARSVVDDPPSGRSVVVLSAGCVDVGGSLAYLPVIELLDGARGLDAQTDGAIDAVHRALGGSAEPGPQDDITVAPAARAATFVRIAKLLAGVAAGRDVIAIVDDLLWADRSTLDVVSFLARRLVGSGAVLVLAYRSDELNRRHPLKPVLADLERHATLDHVRVEPLNAAEVRAQMAAILGAEPDRARLDRIVRLADGNPFHVEELLSLADQPGLPPSLRLVLAARLDQLTDESRPVVQLAAVIGRDVDGGLLSHICAEVGLNVAAGVREAVDARILLSAEDGRQYRFRHALLREAAYEDLSPNERIEAHRRIARALTDQPQVGDLSSTAAVADRARHWRAAGSAPEAFAANLEAARSSAAVTGWAEALAAYEAALGLWEQVDDPASVAGVTRAGILEQAAEIAWYDGDSRRALTLNRRAQAETDVVDDPIRLGRLAGREAWLCDDVGDVVGEGDAAERAVRLTPAEPPSTDRAAALSRLALYAARQGRVHDAAALFEQAIAVATAVGATDEVAVNVAFLTVAWVDLGESERARGAITRLGEMAAQLADPVAWSVIATWTPWAWLGMGEYELAIEYADRLLVDAAGRGLERSLGLWCLAPRALSEFWLGRWDDALDTVARQADYAWGIDAAVYLRSVSAQIAAGRGDLGRARALAEEAIEIARTGFPEQAMVARVAAAWVELLDKQPAAALDHIRAAWAVARTWEGLVIRAQVVWVGLWAAADLATPAARQIGSELAAAASGAIRDMDSRSLSALVGPRLVLALAAAEAARLEQRDDPISWARLADQFEANRDQPRAYLSRQRQAEAALRHGRDRAEAVRAIEAALTLADQLDAPTLRSHALAVAQAGRLKIGSAPQPGSSGNGDSAGPWGLSNREWEILALLGGGRTNRQIADILFISEKTASVHVSHILNKLGVSSRTEAALLAVRAGANK